MSNHRNHRRQEDRRTEHGPTWENPNPGAGCNSTHVAQARTAWKALNHRAERRTGTSLPTFHPPKPFRPVCPVDDPCVSRSGPESTVCCSHAFHRPWCGGRRDADRA